MEDNLRKMKDDNLIFLNGRRPKKKEDDLLDKIEDYLKIMEDDLKIKRHQKNNKKQVQFLKILN